MKTLELNEMEAVEGGIAPLVVIGSCMGGALVAGLIFYGLKNWDALLAY